MSELEVQTAAESSPTEPVKTQKFAHNKEIIAYLAEKFPLCFSVEGEAKPLKVGIFQDLAEALTDDENVSKTQLRQVLRQYTTNWRYLHGCREGAQRVDLSGNSCGEIDKAHAEHALAQLNEAKARLAEKRAAEKAAANKGKKRPQGQLKNGAKNLQRQDKRRERPALKPVSSAQLTAGSTVKVKTGGQAQQAVVLETHKDSARVELDNGLVLDINVDRLFV